MKIQYVKQKSGLSEGENGAFRCKKTPLPGPGREFRYRVYV